jgi:hypothetical protein
MGGMASSVAGTLGPIGMVAGAGVVALGALGAASTQAAMKWEDMKTSIGRTTGLDGSNLQDLMDQLQGLRMEFGITGQAASDMVEQAGSIGVGQKKMETGDLKGYKQEILDFTKATAILQGAWGMSAEATSSGIGKMGSVTLGSWNIQRKARGEEEMSWADYAYKVGGVTDNLANAMGSSEEEIVTAMKNSSGAIAKWAPDEKTYGKWEAMASFLIDTGASVGEAGTQIERVSQKMSQNSDDVAKLMGVDQATLSTSLKADFMGTIQSLGQAVAAMPEGSRPDLFKMFGLEGASMIDKVVADITAGTGKLQGAFDLAAKPGNVAKGYENVADNASKQFARIGEAFQVSLEKIGGQLLPIVTDIASGIADAWIAANEKGTALFAKATAADSKYKNTDIVAAAKDFLGIEKLPANEITSAEMGRQTASTYTNFVNAGIKAGNFDPVTGKMKSVGTEAGKAAGGVFGEVFMAAMKDNKVSEAIGSLIYDSAGNKQMSDKEALVGRTIQVLDRDTKSKTYGQMIDYQTGGINSQSTPGSLTENIKKLDTFFGDYTIQKYTRNKKSTWGSGTVSALDESGEVIKAINWQEARGENERGFAKMSKQLEDSLKPVFLDMPKWMSLKKGEMSSTLAGIISDGMIEGFEKDDIGAAIKKLEDLKVKIGPEFDKAGFDDLLNDYKDTYLGIKLKLDTGEIETNLDLWLESKGDLYLKMRSAAKIEPMKADETRLQEHLVALQERSDAGDKNAARVLELVGIAEDKITKGEPGMLGSLVKIQEELSRKDPELLNLVAWQERMFTADAELKGGVVIVGDRVSIVSTDVKTGTTTLKEASFADSSRIIEAINAKSFNNISNITNNWTSSPSMGADVYRASQFGANGVALGGKQVSDWSNWQAPLVTPGSVQPVTSKHSLLNAILSKNYEVPQLAKGAIVKHTPGGTIANIGEAGKDEIVVPMDGLPCILPLVPENLALYNQDTFSARGQTYDAHDMGYNMQALSGSFKTLNECIQPLDHGFFESHGFYNQDPGIFVTKLGPELGKLGVNVATVNAQYQQQIPIQQQQIVTQQQLIPATVALDDSFTYVSDMWWNADTNNRWTIKGGADSYQSSAKRGQANVVISPEAIAAIKVNPFTGQSSWDKYGMDARINAFVAQSNAARGISAVMPSGPHTEPQWAIDASKGIITKQSHGVLNPLAIERDSLTAVNTVRVRYADLVGTELRNTLILSDAAINASAASGQYCEAMSQQGIMIEETARKAEKNGQFFKSYIGPTKDYEAAKAYFASETVPAIKDNTKTLDYFGNRITTLDGTVANLDTTLKTVAPSKQTSDLLTGGATMEPLTWSLSEFDGIIASAESGLSSCIDSMTTWAKYQESILAMPVDIGGKGFFREESLGGYEDIYPSWGPWATAAQKEGIPGPWGQGGAEKQAGTITGPDGITKALNGSELAKYAAQAVPYGKDTAKNTDKMSSQIKDLNGNLIAVQTANGQIYSDLMTGGAYGMGGGAWGAFRSRYGGSYGSFFGGWSGGGVGTGSTRPGGNVSWGGTHAVEVASSGWSSPGIQYAEGGISYGETGISPGGNIFAEKPGLVEAFVPISDRAAGLRILPQVMRELGIRQFAKGGFAGGSNATAAIGSPITINMPLNVSGSSKAEIMPLLTAHKKAIMKELPQKIYEALKR